MYHEERKQKNGTGTTCKGASKKRTETQNKQDHRNRASTDRGYRTDHCYHYDFRFFRQRFRFGQHNNRIRFRHRKQCRRHFRHYSTDTSLTIEDGDTVNIDYVGSIDGVEFNGGNTQGQGTDLVIGSGRYIDDFEEQLIGAHPGDEVEVTVTFPEDYGNEELNGKEAVFDVTVNGIYQ